MGYPADPQAQVAIRDFAGLIDNNDPHDPDPNGGAEIQTNVCCIRKGLLNVRRGYKVVTFDQVGILI